MTQSSALAGRPWKPRLLYYLLGCYCMLAAASIPLIAWCYAGLGDGKWQSGAGSWDYYAAFGSLSIRLPSIQIYWPGFRLLFIMVAGYAFIGSLLMLWYRKRYPAFAARSMRWPLVHAVLLAILLWRFLAQVAAQSGELTLCLYALLLAVVLVVLAVAFLVALALQRLLGWNLLACYLVLVAFAASATVSIGA